MSEQLWQLHERDVAEAIPDGELTIASGRLSEKLDVQSAADGTLWRWLAGCKSTSGRGISVTAKLWNEVKQAAFSRGPDFRPALPLRIYGPAAPRASDTPVVVDVVVLEITDWSELLWENRRLRSGSTEA